MKKRPTTEKIIRSRESLVRTAKATLESIRGQLYVETNHSYQNTVFLSGLARGGSTWVAELINYDNSYRLVFEPIRTPFCRPFHFGRYIRPGDDTPTFVDRMRTVVNGHFRHVWSDRYNRQPFPRKRLVKEVQANLLLGWLHSLFPAMPLILLLRHPCAILRSRQRLGWKIAGVQGYLKQPALMTDFLSQFRVDMEKASPLEGFFLRWCIDTFVPMKQFSPGQIHLAFYESFCAQPEVEIARLFTFLRRTHSDHILEVLERPSSQLWREDGRLPSRKDLMHGWRHQFSSQEIRMAQDVMRRFGLDGLYGEDGMPNLEAGLVMFGK